MVTKEVSRLIHNPPQFRDTHCPIGTDGRDEFHMDIVYDTVTTVAEMVVANELVARGVSRRRPGEQRDPYLGMALALARCFHNATEYYATVADRRLHPEPLPQEHLLKAMRQEGRAIRKAKKDERRAGARERYQRQLSTKTQLGAGGSLDEGH